MSLREEIAYKLFTSFSTTPLDSTTQKNEWKNNYPLSAETYLKIADKISKIFEKRIDEKLNYLESLGNVKDMEYSDDYKGIIKGLWTVKEMLK